jgi:hypothetical protein
MLLSRANDPRCMAGGHGLCVITRPFAVVLLHRRPLFCRLVHGAQLCTDRQLQRAGRVARGNDDALCATCQRDDLAAAPIGL